MLQILSIMLWSTAHLGTELPGRVKREVHFPHASCESYSMELAGPQPPTESAILDQLLNTCRFQNQCCDIFYIIIHNDKNWMINIDVILSLTLVSAIITIAHAHTSNPWTDCTHTHVHLSAINYSQGIPTPTHKYTAVVGKIGDYAQDYAHWFIDR